MPVGTITVPFQNELTGGITLDNGSITSDGQGNLTAGSIIAPPVLLPQNAGTAPTIATSGTIATASLAISRVTTTAAVTGVILAAGTKAGQTVTVVHEGASANTITFAASGTSNVADGASDVITGPSARLFVWDSVTSLWYAAH